MTGFEGVIILLLGGVSWTLFAIHTNLKSLDQNIEEWRAEWNDVYGKKTPQDDLDDDLPD